MNTVSYAYVRNVLNIRSARSVYALDTPRKRISLNIFIRLQRMPTYWIFCHTSAYVGAIRRSVTGP